MTSSIQPSLELPMLFSPENVPGLIAGTKTQTRRVLRAGFQLEGKSLIGTENFPGVPKLGVQAWFREQQTGDALGVRCPHGQPGNTLWVREPFRFGQSWDGSKPRQVPEMASIRYEADGTERIPLGISLDPWGRFRPGMFLPRHFARILLRVTEVRVEHLQSIDDQSALAEGVVQVGLGWRDYSKDRSLWQVVDSPVDSFRTLWESINGEGSWHLDPLVWVVVFELVGILSDN
jgi:hypothetical protein